jgi:hypothetical protein
MLTRLWNPPHAADLLVALCSVHALARDLLLCEASGDAVGRVLRMLRDLIKRGKLTEMEGRTLAEQRKRGLAARRDKLQREAVQRALHGFDVATREDIERLTKRVEAPEKRPRPESQGLPEEDFDVEY